MPWLRSSTNTNAFNNHHYQDNQAIDTDVDRDCVYYFKKTEMLVRQKTEMLVRHYPLIVLNDHKYKNNFEVNKITNDQHLVVVFFSK